MNAGDLRALVARGATVLEVLEHLSARSSPAALTPFGFLRIFQEELGISFVESRSLLEYFDPQMRPLADADTINERGDLILRPLRS